MSEVVQEINFVIPDEIKWENWRDLPICFFDLETTHSEPSEAQIVQVCAMIFEEWELVDEYETLVNPDIAIPIGAQNTHGISDTDVVDAPSFDEVAPELVKFMYRAELTCAYNGLKFDLPVINNQIEKYAGEEMKVRLPMIDPLVWEREKRDKMYGNSLEKAAKRYGVAEMHNVVKEGDGMFHDARSDVTIMKGVLEERAARLEYTVDALIEEQMEYYQKQQQYIQEKYGD